MRNNQKLLLISLLIVGLSFLLTACQENTIYHSYQSVENTDWFRNDTLTYMLDSCMTSTSSNEFQIGIRHTDSYRYQDLWLGILPIPKDSAATIRIDSCHIYLSNSNGKWKGHGIGELRQFDQAIEITSKGKKTDTIIGFKIFHLMQDQPLKGIQDIGLCIQRKP